MLFEVLRLVVYMYSVTNEWSHMDHGGGVKIPMVW